jgi:hypothetical protein
MADSIRIVSAKAFGLVRETSEHRRSDGALCRIFRLSSNTGSSEEAYDFPDFRNFCSCNFFLTRE